MPLIDIKILLKTLTNAPFWKWSFAIAISRELSHFGNCTVSIWDYWLDLSRRAAGEMTSARNMPDGTALMGELASSKDRGSVIGNTRSKNKRDITRRRCT
jgi:hypothetical protein